MLARWLSCFFIFTTFNAWSIDDIYALSIEQLLDVSVTSTSFFKQSYTESASSVSVRQQHQWQQMGVRNVGELLNTLPATVAPQAHGKSRVVAVRGYFNYSIDSGVATLIDGVPINVQRFGTGMQAIDGFDLTTLESVEMIRGPGSALHGPDAFHGVVALNTLAHGDTGASVTFDIGQEDYSLMSLNAHMSQGNHQLTLAASERVIGDQNLRYPYFDTDSQQLAFSARRNQLDNHNLLLKYTYQYSSNTSINGLAYSLDLDAQQLQGLGRQLGADTMQDKDWSDYSAQLDLVRLGLNHYVNAQNEISFSGYYWQYHDVEKMDFRDIDFIGYATHGYRQEHNWGLQLVNRYTPSNQHKVALGYEYHAAKNDLSDGHRIFPNDQLVINRLAQHGVSNDVHSLIVDGSWFFSARLNQASHIAYSARVDEISGFGTQLSPRLGFFQPLNTNHLVKVLFSRSYRKPTSYEIYGSGSVAENSQVKPEQLTNLELVWQMTDTNHLTSLSVFRNRWTNSIRGVRLAQAIDGKDFQFQNATHNQAWGLELESKVNWQQFDIEANASYIVSKNTETNEEYRAFPDWLVNLGLGYYFNPQWRSHVLLRYQHRNTDSTPAFANPQPEQNIDFIRVDLMTGWVGEKVEVSAAIRNVFNRTNTMPAYFDRLAGSPGNRRNVSLSAKFKF
ncbi:hypothetical protein C2869_22035 (plasmid) [Saccharobesus litoralis]|uniref:TonB-dependent receptor n=1 Tax=Saccharobesus litoralis TaxID=2172099 RepID=A0A2S0VY97_9ALTE|nr:TonB-dependent receptor [Saccharobesus litoralis]AWB69184.1 hypothetical protein C2869_22035 [Saccharobesus litoralis]